jgi:tetratricopeptide (TPR) repeat protein
LFDSASVAYRRVDSQYPTGDKVPAALYKLGLSQEKLKQTDAAKKTFEDLVKRFPNSGEAHWHVSGSALRSAARLALALRRPLRWPRTSRRPGVRRLDRTR